MILNTAFKTFKATELWPRQGLSCLHMCLLSLNVSKSPPETMSIPWMPVLLSQCCVHCSNVCVSEFCSSSRNLCVFLPSGTGGGKATAAAAAGVTAGQRSEGRKAAAEAAAAKERLQVCSVLEPFSAEPICPSICNAVFLGLLVFRCGRISSTYFGAYNNNHKICTSDCLNPNFIHIVNWQFFTPHQPKLCKFISVLLASPSWSNNTRFVQYSGLLLSFGRLIIVLKAQ